MSRVNQPGAWLGTTSVSAQALWSLILLQAMATINFIDRGPENIDAWKVWGSFTQIPCQEPLPDWTGSYLGSCRESLDIENNDTSATRSIQVPSLRSKFQDLRFETARLKTHYYLVAHFARVASLKRGAVKYIFLPRFVILLCFAWLWKLIYIWANRLYYGLYVLWPFNWTYYTDILVVNMSRWRKLLVVGIPSSRRKKKHIII
jgi:hypothetical protein